MLLPKFDILNKIKKKNHNTCKCDNYRICCFCCIYSFTNIGNSKFISIGIYCLFVDWHFYFFRYDNLVF